MNKKPRRRVWQIHLSTAVVLMFVAGAWVGVLVITDPGPTYPDPTIAKHEARFLTIEVWIQRFFIIIAMLVSLWVTRNVCEWWIETPWGWHE